jgi:hypothetical protein
VRRESTDIEDVFIGHIGAMDTFALALRRAAAMHESGVVQRMVDQRYASYADGIGAKVCVRCSAQCCVGAAAFGSVRQMDLGSICADRGVFAHVGSEGVLKTEQNSVEVIVAIVCVEREQEL